MRTIILLLLASPLFAECGPIRHISGNFAFDLVGQPETRAYHWGTVEAQVVPLVFTAPPVGTRIRILSISGDLTARWTTQGRGRAWPGYGYYTGVLAAVMLHPDSRGSDYANHAADDHFAYIQADIGFNGVVRAAFKETFDPSDENALLHTADTLAIEALRGGDLQGAWPNTIYFKFAKFLDESGLATHGEITFSRLSFCYEAVR